MVTVYELHADFAPFTSTACAQIVADPAVDHVFENACLVPDATVPLDGKIISGVALCAGAVPELMMTL